MINEIIAGGIVSIVLFFLGYCVQELRSIRKEMRDTLTKEKFESILAHRRIDICENVLSGITEQPLMTRSVIEQGATPPKIDSKVLRVIHASKD